MDGRVSGVLDVSCAHVYAPLVDVRHWPSKIAPTPAMAFAVSALVVELAFLLVPLNVDGSNILFSGLSLREGFPLRVNVAWILTLLSQAVVILIGLMLLRRGREAMASGLFLGLLVILGIRLTNEVLTTPFGWPWQTAVYIGLQMVECVLLLLAARAAARQREAPVAAS
jgi:hypothetical protein